MLSLLQFGNGNVMAWHGNGTHNTTAHHPVQKPV